MTFVLPLQGSRIRNQDIEYNVRQLTDNAQKILTDLQKRVQAQKTKEEQERVRKLQEEMEKERKRREDEEKSKNAHEEERLQRIQLEERRKLKEERARHAAQDNKALAVSWGYN